MFHEINHPSWGTSIYRTNLLLWSHSSPAVLPHIFPGEKGVDWKTGCSHGETALKRLDKEPRNHSFVEGITVSIVCSCFFTKYQIMINDDCNMIDCQCEEKNNDYSWSFKQSLFVFTVTLIIAMIKYHSMLGIQLCYPGLGSTSALDYSRLCGPILDHLKKRYRFFQWQLVTNNYGSSPIFTKKNTIHKKKKQTSTNKRVNCTKKNIASQLL